MGKKKKVKSALEGYCSICKKFTKLTRDHVPPRGSINLQPVEIRMFHEHLKGAVSPVPVETHQIDENLYLRRKTVELSQSGVNFRSICDSCNNTLLGRRYDPELI